LVYMMQLPSTYFEILEVIGYCQEVVSDME
jgi:hypothetical protein